MYGKDYLEWRDTQDAWERLHGMIECELAGMDDEIRRKVLQKMRAEYAIDNIDNTFSLLRQQDVLRNAVLSSPQPNPYGNPFVPTHSFAIFG